MGPLLRAGPAARQATLNPDLNLLGWSTLDWCEENYAVLTFVAEFWNTITNLVMMISAVYGIRIVKRLDLEQRFAIAFWGLFAIGLGSFLFHATLTYGGQLLDEVPMIWASCSFIYCGKPSSLRPRLAIVLKWCLFCYASMVTVLYATYFKHYPIFHEVAYGILVVMIIVSLSRGIASRPSHSRRQLLGLFLRGLFSYGIGFMLWNIDNLFCGDVRNLRDSLPQMVRPALQLHAWWHVAQIGTFDSIIMQILLNHRRADSLVLTYVAWWVPVLSLKPAHS